MPNRKIKAILFDLGETLLNFGPVDKSRVFKEAGRLTYEYLSSNGHQPGDLKKYIYRNLLKLRIKVLFSNIFKNDFDSLEVIRQLGQKQGLNLTGEQWQHLNWLWYEPLAKQATVEDDLKQTLNNLQNRGLALGIISNTFVHATSLDRHLEKFGLLEYFPMRIYSYQMPWRKPDKRIFIKGAKKINCQPAEIVYVGDRIDADVKGSTKAGMFPVLKKAYTNENKTPPRGTAVIENISELETVLDSLNPAD